MRICPRHREWRRVRHETREGPGTGAFPRAPSGRSERLIQAGMPDGPEERDLLVEEQNSRSCSSWLLGARYGRFGRCTSPDIGRTAATLPFMEVHLAVAEELTVIASADPHGTAGVGDAAGDGLADLPGGVGGALEALAPIDFVDRVDETEVAFLDQVLGGTPAA